MKKKTIKCTVYQCESCNTKLDFPSSITNCRICGKEVCANCKRYLSIIQDRLLYTKEDLQLKSNTGGILKFYEVYEVCKDCYEKLMTKSDVYEECVQHFVDEFNENIDKLNDKYIKGEL